MTNKTSRMAHLLGELRREMNGAVVGSMRYYGVEYGLNYGVSIPTIRAMWHKDQKICDHSFARYLYSQEVRELRLLALWYADHREVSKEVDFWCRGIINSEVAEEAAFALLHRVEGVEKLLDNSSELIQYTSLMALSSSTTEPTEQITGRIGELLSLNPSLLPKGVVALLERWIRRGYRDIVCHFVEELPHCGACSFIREEIEWRLGE